MSSKLAIVTAADSRFLPAACCQLLSVAENLPNRNSAELFLIAFNIEICDIRKAEKFFAAHELNIQILNPNLETKIVSHPSTKRFSLATYIRLYLDEVFDNRWGRILYFDADTRVCAPLRPLLEADLAGMSLGAVHDYILYVTGHVHQARRNVGLGQRAPYFNAGVIVFDWPLTLSTNKLEAARRFITDYPERCPAFDQDALNFAFENAWKSLDPRWNLYHFYLLYGRRLKPYVMHFTSAKPWSRSRLPIWREAANWYEEKLQDSPWPEFVEPQSSLDAVRVRTRLFDKRYRPILRDKISEYAPFFLRWFGKERDRTYLPWTPRRNSDVERVMHALIMEADGRCAPLRPPEAVLDPR